MRLDGFLRDLALAARSARRTPASTFVAIGTLAAGLALTACAFALVKGVWLRPLEFPEAERLVSISNHIPAARVAAFPLSPPEVQAYAGESLWQLAAYQSGNFNLGAVERPLFVRGARVTPAFFDVLQARPLRGRLPAAADVVAEGTPVAVITEGLWREALAGDATVLERSIALDGVTHRVVAVLPDRFAMPRDARVWTLLRFDPTELGPDGLGQQLNRTTARLADGITVERAREHMNAVAARFHATAPEFYETPTEWRIEITRMVDTVRAPVAASVLLVAGAVLLLLLVTVGNVAGLLGARGLDRMGELAVRVALGARGWLLVRASLAEGLVIAVAAGAAGLLAARLAGPWVARLGPPELQRFPVQVDTLVGVALAGLAIAVGALASAAPAVRALRVDPASLLRAATGGMRTPHRLRGALVAMQVGATFLLLSGAFALMNSFVQVSRLDPGFAVDGVLTARTSLPAATVPSPIAVVRAVLENLRTSPEVRAAAATTILPLSGRDARAAFYLEDETVERAAGTTSLHRRYVTRDYLRALDIPLLGGRWIEDGDDAQATPVVVVNRTFAERVWPGRDPIGRRIAFDQAGPWVTVVGVVEDVKHAALDAPVVLEAFYPLAQATAAQARDITFVLRGERESDALVPLVQRALEARLPGHPLFEVRGMDAVLRASLGGRRFSATLPGFFGALALALSIFAVYGAVRASVAERMRELGVKQVLGASPMRIARDILQLGLAPVAIGLGLGALAGPVLTPAMSALLPGAGVTVAGALSAGAALLAGAVLGSISVAYRALRHDPATVMRAQ